MIWLAFQNTGSPLATGVVVVAGFAPELLQPAGGALGDRLDRPKLLMAAHGISALVAVSAALLVGVGWASYPQLVAAAALAGMAYWPAAPVRGALLLDIVGTRQISAANAMLLVAGAGGSVAPVIAGLCIERAGSAAALWFTAGCFVMACWALRRMVEPRRHREGAASGGLGAAVRVVTRTPELRALFGVTLAVSLFGWPAITAFLPVFADEVFGVGAFGLGLMLGAFGAGEVCGALGLVALGDIRSKGRVFLAGTMMFGGGLAVFAITPVFGLALGLLFLVGVASACFEVLRNTLALLAAPAESRGAVFGVVRLAAAVMPAALLAQAAAAELVGVVPVTVGAGTALICCVLLVGLMVPSWARPASRGA